MLLNQVSDEEDLFAGDLLTAIAPLCIGGCGHLIRSMPENVSERKSKMMF